MVKIGRSCSIVTAFTWGNGGSAQNISDRTVGVPTDIRTGHLPKISQKRDTFRQLALY